MKKYIVIPHDTYERLSSAKEDLRSRLADSERKLYDIMKMEISLDEKRILYLQALQKFLHENDVLQKPVKLKLEEDMLNSHIETDVTAVKDRFHGILSVVLPKTLVSKGLTLYDYLVSLPAIKWDVKGKVSIYDQEIQHSNIVDIITDLTRNRATMSPTGWNEIKTLMKSHNTPLSLINNDARVKELSIKTLDTSLAESVHQTRARTNLRERHRTAPYSKIPKLQWKRY